MRFFNGAEVPTGISLSTDTRCRYPQSAFIDSGSFPVQQDTQPSKHVTNKEIEYFNERDHDGSRYRTALLYDRDGLSMPTQIVEKMVPLSNQIYVVRFARFSGIPGCVVLTHFVTPNQSSAGDEYMSVVIPVESDIEETQIVVVGSDGRPYSGTYEAGGELIVQDDTTRETFSNGTSTRDVSFGEYGLQVFHHSSNAGKYELRKNDSYVMGIQAPFQVADLQHQRRIKHIFRTDDEIITHRLDPVQAMDFLEETMSSAMYE